MPAAGDGAGGGGRLQDITHAGDVEAGIEGAIHAMRVLQGGHSQEENQMFILVDGQNSFNEEKRTAMLWAIWKDWPSGAQFTFK